MDNTYHFLSHLFPTSLTRTKIPTRLLEASPIHCNGTFYRARVLRATVSSFPPCLLVSVSCK